jgi:hypothetical protein
MAEGAGSEAVPRVPQAVASAEDVHAAKLRDPTCELCEAARLSDWYYEDDVCWIAECEACFVPMVVWKRHDPNPPEEVRVELFQRLSAVADRMFSGEYWIDDRLRSIPGHYHAHARRRPR